MKKVLICLTLIISCSISVAFGFVMGNSNLDMMGYPEFKTKHYPPSKPYSKDEYSMKRYRQEVSDYIEEANRYIDSANNDIQRIQESKVTARNEANSAVDDYNNFIHHGY